ncbi:MAG TPA: hypothetical protein VGP72_28855 [Planctomycetota bacterium]
MSDFYDGALRGLAECSVCHKSYRFDTVDWDFDKNVRAVVLGRLPGNEFDVLADLMAKAEEPSWPFWAPLFTARTHMAAETVKAVDDATEATERSAALPNLLVAWSSYCEEIMGSTRIPTPTANEFRRWTKNLHSKEWFRIVGVEDRNEEESGTCV